MHVYLTSVLLLALAFEASGITLGPGHGLDFFIWLSTALVRWWPLGLRLCFVVVVVVIVVSIDAHVVVDAAILEGESASLRRRFAGQIPWKRKQI